MQWNELDYDLQTKIIDRIVDLLTLEEDYDIQDGIIAAVHELEMWSNSPCLIVEEEIFVAQAVDQEDDNK